MNRISCILGIHDWGYMSKKTGICLHTFHNKQLARPLSYYNRKRCWDCKKTVNI